MTTKFSSITDSQRYAEVKDTDAGNDSTVKTTNGFVALTKPTTGTWTLTLPAAGKGDGSYLTILNPTDVDHTVEFGSPSTSLVVPAGKTAYLNALGGNWYVG
jgi:hypothetical protein